MRTKSGFPKILLISTVFLSLTVGACAQAGEPSGGPKIKPPSDEAIALRNRGIAELENEKPVLAEAAFLELTKVAPDDPLGYGNLAIATLRQQKFEEAREWIAKGIEKSPDDPWLWAIEAEIHQWSGQPDAALAGFERAAEAAPDDIEIQYSLYRQATTVTNPSEAGGQQTAALAALDRLSRLRPENLVVLLELGSQARIAGDQRKATAAYTRIRELIWQAPRGGDQLLEQVFEGLESGDLGAIRTPAQRLNNVLKITPMYRESLRELATGIQGVPIQSLAGEPQATTFGSPIEVSFRSEPLGAQEATAVLDLVIADFDGDETPDVAALVGADPTRLELRAATDGSLAGSPVEAPGIERLLAADLDNDGHQDVVGYGKATVRFWRGDGAGALVDSSEAAGLSGASSASAAAVIDFDIEGDLDLFVAGADPDSAPEIYRNALSGPLEAVGSNSLPQFDAAEVRDVLASDLDRDGDLDLLLAHADRLTYLGNLRQGRFEDRSGDAGLTLSSGANLSRVASADLDNDGLPDVIAMGDELLVWRNLGGTFETWSLGDGIGDLAGRVVVAFDADNDGRLDLALGGGDGVSVIGLDPQSTDGLRRFSVDGGPASVSAIVAADVDGDGDLDLIAGGADGLFRLINEGGNQNGWLSVELRGLATGSSKNNSFGIGSTLEVRAADAYQFREASGDVTHFGLGDVDTADLLRVVWTNGVPQNRISPTARQRVVEEQLLKGSCPFLYTWTGEHFEFATDLLWGAPAGLPMGIDKWMPSDPEELVEIEHIAPRNGNYEIRITEELWEAAFFDYLRLWVVDHPSDIETASSLKILPGSVVVEEVLGTRGLRELATVWDARGRDVTERVRARDGIYADGWEKSRYQGVPAEPWTFTFDLGEDTAEEQPIRLHLDGWIFPSDASLNIALDQGQQFPFFPPRLEVETAEGWQVLAGNIGFPAGKTKTMVVDTPPLPAGARKLRIVASQWLSWDRIAWAPAATAIADHEPKVRAQLEASTADLRFRGFNRLYRTAPNAPHEFDYAQLSTESPWLPFPGRYTRYGDVKELLRDPDDRSVVLAAGDEMVVVFDGADLPPVEPGWSRTLFLESHGWDKDADRNTFEPEQVEPLPFRNMAAYGEPFPDTAFHRKYVEEWLTRVVEAPDPGEPAGLFAGGRRGK